MIGTTELILILALALLLFGGKKLPELARNLGKGMKAFREGLNNKDDEIVVEPVKDKEEEEQKTPHDS